MIFIIHCQQHKKLVGVFDSLENAVQGMERALPVDKHQKKGPKSLLVGIRTLSNGKTVIVSYETGFYRDTVSYVVQLREMNKLVREETLKKVNWAFALNMEDEK